MTDTAYPALCEQAIGQWLTAHTGIALQAHQWNTLRRTLADAMEKFSLDGCEHYLRQLHEGANDSPLVDHLIAGVTVGESYFFRDADQLALLEQRLLPELLRRQRARGQKLLRIWSAGCSSGQEIYTLAIMLQGLLADPHDWHLHLLGTDINSASLDTARQGRYSAWSLRATPTALRERYFIRHH